MKSEEYVYFLTVREAREIASRHEEEEEWDIWKDAEAQEKGRRNYNAKKEEEEARLEKERNAS